ncbi:uncharacterized protein FIBRA_05519 [Fibroporia radiculosa]|uniref:DUF6741 domain-containing protein n=1 Tax=Fibroporia radiculosa TaxID=599839 RepID=J4H3K2_9APHY|nr:uncharacterized protein FIBRA_05519 [Fibroporia radiculosa]CCM03389.1 predicted protein [Fibroporia radiculosa]
MAYAAYDTGTYPQLRRSLSYGQQYAGYPHSDYMYDQPVAAGVYGDTYPQVQGSYPAYAPSRTVSQYHPYDDMAIRDSYYPEYATSGYGTPYAPSLARRRSSRRSRVGFEGHRRNSSMIKFKRKGGFRSGIMLGEAMANVQLSSNDYYTSYDLGADHRGKISLRIRWTGYTSMTYDLPVDSYDGRVELQTLARRVARACMHFIQASAFTQSTVTLLILCGQTNMIPVAWDRIMLFQLEETGTGLWQPVLSSG